MKGTRGDIEQKYRQIQIDGLVPFARGGMGECYRLDKETNNKLDLIVMLMRLFLVSNFGDKIPGEYCDKTRQDIQDMFG